MEARAQIEAEGPGDPVMVDLIWHAILHGAYQGLAEEYGRDGGGLARRAAMHGQRRDALTEMILARSEGTPTGQDL